MTHAQMLQTLKVNKEKKAKALSKFQCGFADADEIIEYLNAGHAFKKALAAYHEYFSYCVRNNINLENEII